MNTLVRKFIISIISVIFVISILGTVTYAWFSLAKTNALDNLQVTAATGDEFQISLDGINYSKSISSEDIMNAIGNNLELRDVTSFDGINFQTGGPGGTDLATKNVDYASFTLWFRTTRAERHVYLVENVSHIARYDEGKEGTYVVSRGINWKADNNFLNGDDLVNDMIHTGDRDLYYAANAMRLSFVEEKIIDNQFDLRENFDLSNKIFDLSQNPARGFGALFGGLYYYNVKHATKINPPTNIPNTIYELTDFEETNPYIPLNENSKILELIKTEFFSEDGNTYYVGKVQVNIWLEGWDADCFNSIYNDSIRVQLKFFAANSLSSNL